MTTFLLFPTFTGLHDRAKIVFTYNRAEEPTSEHKGWGVGRIGSSDDSGNGPSVTVAELPNNQKGDQSVTVLYQDIKKALAATESGIVFAVWSMDNAASTRVKVEAFNATVDATVTAISTAKVAAQETGVRYNLAGQKVAEGYKGLVIMNGKKVVLK